MKCFSVLVSPLIPKEKKYFIESRVNETQKIIFLLLSWITKKTQNISRLCSVCYNLIQICQVDSASRVDRPTSSVASSSCRVFFVDCLVEVNKELAYRAAFTKHLQFFFQFMENLWIIEWRISKISYSLVSKSQLLGA